MTHIAAELCSEVKGFSDVKFALSSCHPSSVHFIQNSYDGGILAWV